MMQTTDITKFKEYQKTKNINLRNEIAIKNSGLVHYVVKKFFNRPEYAECKPDLIQEGQLGLFQAIDNFDPDLGFKFSTYATWWIRQMCSNYLSDVRPEIYVPGHIRTAQNKFMKVVKEKGINPTDLSINPEDYELTPNMLASIRAGLASKQIMSIDTPVSKSSESSATLADIIQNNDNMEEKVSNCELIHIVRRALDNLSEKEKMILHLRYKLICDEC
jgi:RNA polymerase primary sigma factor